MNKWQDAYMKTAETFGSLSTAQRLKVGAIAVKDNRIISIGYNGMPSGWTNECEDWIEDDEYGTNGPPYMVASVNYLDDIEEYQVLIKNYSENEGILEVLIENGFVKFIKNVFLDFFGNSFSMVGH